MNGRTVLNGVLIGAIAVVLLWAFATPPGSWGDGSADAQEDPDYWFVHLVGSESRQHLSGNETAPRSCEPVEAYEVHAATQELVVPSDHDRDQIGSEGRALLLDLKEEWSGCPVAYGVATQELLERTLGRFGHFYYEMVENGTVYLGNGTTLRPGETLEVTYTEEVELDGARYRIDGRFELVHHGAWAKDDIRLKKWD